MRTAKTLIRLGGCPGLSVFARCTSHSVGFVKMRLIIYCKANMAVGEKILKMKIKRSF